MWCCDAVCWSDIFFFFKQKTAYEMRISDWSSDVCSSDLLVDQIDAGDFFGHRVFDLQARVHFQEVELSALAEDEFDGAGVAVANRAGDAGRGLADLLAQRGIERRRRGFIDDLLEAALDRAFPLPHVHHASLAVAHSLHFDLTRVSVIAFIVQSA